MTFTDTLLNFATRDAKGKAVEDARIIDEMNNVDRTGSDYED